jgi:hypothetical protein
MMPAMTLTRRALLAIAPAYALSDPIGPALYPGPSETVVLRAGPLQEGLILPARRARIIAGFPLGGRELVGVGFGVDLKDGVMIDIVAVCAAPATGPPKLLALEIASYFSPDLRLTSRVAAASDQSCLRIARVASTIRAPTLVFRSSWMDYLRWNDGGPLADSPVHPPPPGTVAADLATRRARVRVALGADVGEITPALLDDTRLALPLTPEAPVSPPPPERSRPSAG